MASHMSRILDGLYVGNVFDAKNTYQMDIYKISHIISVLAGKSEDMMPDKYYLCIVADDKVEQNLMQFFSISNDFIHAARLSGNNVLIHCLVGVSRSATLACAYLMAVTDLNYKKAMTVVCSRRSSAQPNLGFNFQLEQYERFCLKAEKERLSNLFPSSSLILFDRLDCEQCFRRSGDHEVKGTLSQAKGSISQTKDIVSLKDTMGSEVDICEPFGGNIDPDTNSEKLSSYLTDPDSDTNILDQKPDIATFSMLFPMHVRKPFLKKPSSFFTTEKNRDGIQLMANVCLYIPTVFFMSDPTKETEESDKAVGEVIVPVQKNQEQI